MLFPNQKVFVPGFTEIRDNAGALIDDVNKIRLGPEFVLSKNTADPSANLSVAAYIASQIAAGNATAPVLIQKATLSGASFTSSAWTAGIYSKIRVDFNILISGGYLRIQMNADSGTNYFDVGTTNAAGALSADNSDIAVLGYSRIAATLASVSKSVGFTEFDITTDGSPRLGTANSAAFKPATGTSKILRSTSFGWTNTATDVTFITLSTDVAFSGTIRIYGTPI